MRILLPFILSVVIAFPPLAFAQDFDPITTESNYSGVNAGLVTCGGIDCDACDLVSMVNNIINWLITIMSAVAVLSLMVAGFRMVTAGGDEGSWTAAKSRFMNIVIGFILFLAAWLIVDTVLKGLTGQGLDFYGNIDCTAAAQQTAAQVTNADEQPGTNAAVLASAGKYTDSDARQALSNAGITVNKTMAQGTSLEGINKSTIDEAIRVQRLCNCEVVITAGTEGGHTNGTYSHGNGYKIDLRRSSELTTYIQQNFRQSGTRNGDNAILYTDYTTPGVTYALEGDHWDVSVN